jgi:hypothetical protein
VVSRVVRVLGVASVFAACTPSFSDQTSLITAPRLLAIQAVPAEASPGSSFSMTALYVGPGGPADPSSLNWATCLLQKPLGDPGPFNPSCFVDASSGLVPLGVGGSVQGTIPEDACVLFGPDTAPAQPGQPSPRPTDPDSTGGFYLPVRVEADERYSVAPERITCQPGGVTQSVFAAFSDGYKPNQNPVLFALSRVGDDGGASPLAPDSAGKPPSLTVAPGERVLFSAEWPTCPTTATECSGAETYLYIDPASRETTTKRESMVASWYATGGAFDVDSVGRAADDLGTTAINAWTAPASAAAVELWVVLRDARGGIGWGSYAIAVSAHP